MVGEIARGHSSALSLMTIQLFTFHNSPPTPALHTSPPILALPKRLSRKSPLSFPSSYISPSKATPSYTSLPPTPSLAFPFPHNPLFRISLPNLSLTHLPLLQSHSLSPPPSPPTRIPPPLFACPPNPCQASRSYTFLFPSPPHSLFGAGGAIRVGRL